MLFIFLPPSSRRGGFTDCLILADLRHEDGLVVGVFRVHSVTGVDGRDLDLDVGVHVIESDIFVLYRVLPATGSSSAPDIKK